MPLISKEEVEHVALLGRLELSAAEKERLAVELNRILDAFAELQALDVEGVEPTAHAIPMTNVFREDEVGQCLAPEQVLEDAPDRTDQYFRVPKIIEEL